MPAMRVCAWALALLSATGADAAKCCYSGPKDCDDEQDWCSKDASRCETCKGTFHNATELDLAEVAEPLMLAAEEVSGRCCYTSPSDCDGSKDYCSKDKAHCTDCGGTFHAKKEAAPSNDTAVTQLAALALQLAALPAANAQAQTQQADTREEREPRDQRQQREQREQPQQPQGDWDRFIPSQYSHFISMKNDAHASRNHTEASRSKATTFLGVPEGSIAPDPLSKAALACLSVAGLAMVMVAAVRANRRTVTPHTEVLG